MMAHPPPRPDRQPRLAIVVDTEEEFDWGKPFDRANTSVSAIPAQAAAHEIYDRFGIVPTYVIGYPVATDPAAAGFLRALQQEKRAEIGAHLHPWVTPPHEENVSTRNSYGCNLPPALERAKIETLTHAIAAAFGERPTIFKAGRYGYDRNTGEVLADLGYTVDCSFVPHASFAGDGGPDFHGRSDQPFWLNRARRLLEVPLTNGYWGPLENWGDAFRPFYDNRMAERLRLPGLLSRTGLLTRSRLTPEGVSAREQCRLLDAQTARGKTVFTLTYHSPSLAPGNTSYVRSEADLTAFLATIEAVLVHFRDRLGGRFTTLSEIHADHVAALPAIVSETLTH